MGAKKKKKKNPDQRHPLRGQVYLGTKILVRLRLPPLGRLLLALLLLGLVFG